MSVSSNQVTLSLLADGLSNGTLLVVDNALLDVGATCYVSSNRRPAKPAVILSKSGSTGVVVNGDMSGYLQSDGAQLFQPVETVTLPGAVSGVATLGAGGTVTVSTSAVLATDNVILSCQAPGGTQGFLSVGTITAGTSFVINSTNAADTSVVYWQLKH